VTAVREYHVASLASVRAYLGKAHGVRNTADVQLSDRRALGNGRGTAAAAALP